MMRHLLLVLALTPLPAWAEVRAVLVGVSDYAHLDADLQGPANDVGLMAETLMARGVAAGAITALAEAEAPLPAGVRRGQPDRAAILAALGAAIEGASRGDSVVFYFSGHGAQAPDADGDEGGGMDEIFLPRDARGWNGGTGRVENAILDDDLADFTRRAAARGVALIGIIDACHSGTGFRAVPTADARARYVAPAALGLPEPDAPEATAGAAAAPPGDYVFLYAAQSDQRAFEYPVGDERRWHGDFTLALAQVLREVPDLSYAALVEAAAARMRRTGGQAVQTPDVEGPLADAAVLGGDAPGMTRLPVAGQVLGAGLLRGVTEGSTVTLYADALATDPAGTARVTAVRATQADLAYDAPFPTVKVTHAELTERAVDLGLRIGVTAQARAALGGAAPLAALDLPGDAGPPTHLLVVDGTAFALTGADGLLDPGRSLPLGPAETLSDRLPAAVARLRLERALAQIDAGPGQAPFTLGARGPETAFTIAPGRVRADGSCATPRGAAQPADASAEAGHCDVVTLTFRNTTAGMQDVSVLYIDAQHRIETLWPRRNLSNRIEAGGSRTLGFALRAGETPLREAMIVLAVPAEPGSMRTRIAPSGATGPLGSYLAGVADPAPTRGFSLKPKGAALSVARLDLVIAPKGD